jgi:hypothetical protein
VYCLQNDSPAYCHIIGVCNCSTNKEYIWFSADTKANDKKLSLKERSIG